MTNSSFDMPKTYDFTAAEQRLYDWWEVARLVQTGSGRP